MPNMMQGAGGPRGMRQRPEASEVAKQIFSKLDTDNQGYLDAGNFASAISQLSPSGQNSNTASSDEVFASLDGDSDGKVTQDELAQGIKSLQEQLDSQFNTMRMQGGMQGMGGAHPHHHEGEQAQDKGLDQTQLGDMASAASQAGDSQAASMFSQLASNFTDADADGDGKVSFSESIAYQHKQQATSSHADSTNDGTGSANNAGSSSQAMQGRIAQRLMEMMRAYDDQASTYQTSSMRSAA
jgi:Ca2+-binding EF-hand superfamily protein